jgi:hypothetical protein
MGLLDAVSGGGLNPTSMIPGGELLSVVSKGLDLIKSLMDGNDMKGADKVLDMLSKMIENTGGAQGPAASEPEPFSTPQGQGAASADGQSLHIDIQMPQPAQMVSHPVLPEVDGSAQGDQNLSHAARPFVEGSDAAKNRALNPGSNEWTTVMWAMQKNPNISYDADSQRFFTKMSDGSKRDVCSLQDLQNVVQQNGGFNRANPTAAGAVDGFLKDKVDQAQNAPFSTSVSLDLARAAGPSGSGSGSDGPSIDELNGKLDELKKKLLAFEQGHQLMNATAQHLTVTVTT